MTFVEMQGLTERFNDIKHGERSLKFDRLNNLFLDISLMEQDQFTIQMAPSIADEQNA